MPVKTKNPPQKLNGSEKYIGVRCDDEFYKRLVRLAHEDKRPVSAMLRVLAEESMDSREYARTNAR